MGTTNSTPIPGGGTEGYHVLKVTFIRLYVKNKYLTTKLYYILHITKLGS